MIFVDSNVYIYAVGKDHPLRDTAQQFFLAAIRAEETLVTSAEVLQELMHVYVPVARWATLDAAFDLAMASAERIFPIDTETVLAARQIAATRSHLTARDLIHLATCWRHRIQHLKTFDRQLDTAFGQSAPAP